MKTMRGAFCSGPREIEVRELPWPEPSDDQVVVRVRACGICGSDLHFYLGHFPPPASCTGHELAGEVAAVGRATRNVREGDRVAVEPIGVCGECHACARGDYHLCP
jgi:threonine dehydrogenase-like Zn-dependent dehydrogenase